MNIIQVQNRLKGVTDEALVQYVENPTGEVPTYLALGEIGRREDMRKQYQASQAEQPQKTVAEEMVAQLSTPTGIGALTNNMAPRMAPEEVMSTSESISETGVANLPIDMPQNFERGGIVGYAEGGNKGLQSGKYRYEGMTPENENYETYLEEIRKIPEPSFSGINQMERNRLINQIKDKYKSPYKKEIEAIESESTGGFYFDPKTSSGFNPLRGLDFRQYDDQGREDLKYLRDQEEKYYTGKSDIQNKLKEQNLEKKEEARNRKDKRDQPKEEVAPSKTMADYVAEFKTSLGDDPLRKKMEERMAKMDERAEKSEKNALFDSMITAGLTMAAGKDQNAINNIAVGALRGVKTYEDALEARDVLDEKQLTLQMQMSKADRAEQIAAIEYGMQSQQFQETQDLKAAIASQSNAIDLMKIQIDSGEFGEKIKKNKADAYDDIIDQEGDAVEDFIDDWFESNGREYDLKDPEFMVAYENFMDKKVADRRGEKGRIPTPGFRLVP